MAATVVDATELARGRLVVVQELAIGLVQGLGQHGGTGIVVAVAQVLERGGQGQEFTQRIPAQVVLFHELLHVLGSRTTGAGFEQATTGHQRHDGEHLGAGAQFHDREQVGEVIAQHVAGHRDGVFTLADAVQRERGRFHRSQDADVQAVGIVVLEVGFDLGDHLRIVRARGIQPEYGRGAAQAGAVDGQLDPVLDRGVLGLAHAPDVAGLHGVFEHHVAGIVGDAHGAVGRNLEGLVVRAVFFGLLRHQADVRHRAHGGRVERAVGDAVVDHGLVYTGVAAVRNDSLGVLQLAVGIPHATGVADHGRHRGIDDDVAGHVQVGDALVGIDHGQARALAVFGSQVGLDRFLGGFRQLRQARVQVADAVVGVEAGLLEHVSVLGQYVLVELFDDHAEHDRVGDLHHGGLQVQREQDALGLGIGDLRLHERGQRVAAHHRGIDDLTGLDGGLFLQHDGGAVSLLQFDLQVAGGGQGGRLFAAVEIAAVHVRNVRLRFVGPLAHAVRVLAGVVLDRQRRAAVGIAFAQHRVHRAALDLVIARLDVARDVVSGHVRVVGQGIALVLQFLDGRLELRHRGADVGQFDDVGVRGGRQLAQLGQVVGFLLVVLQEIREQRQDAAGQRDVAGFDCDAGGGSVGLDDRQQRLGGQERGFIGKRVQNLGRVRHGGQCSPGNPRIVAV